MKVEVARTIQMFCFKKNSKDLCPRLISMCFCFMKSVTVLEKRIKFITNLLIGLGVYKDIVPFESLNKFLIFVSFLDNAIPKHWKAFEDSLGETFAPEDPHQTVKTSRELRMLRFLIIKMLHHSISLHVVEKSLEFLLLAIDVKTYH